MRIAYVNPPQIDSSMSNPATWMFMKTYYDEVGQHKDQVEWLEPPYKFNKYKTVQEIYEEVKTADVIMFSSYIWNYHIVDELATYVKKISPKTITVVGGPHLGEKEIDKRPMYDYFCKVTCPGELFMEDFIDSWFKNNQKPVIEDISFEVRSYKKKPWAFPKTSAYRQNFEYLSRLKKYAEDNDMRPYVIIETTRGCPFACVFCEWGGGIGTKIIKKDVEIVHDDLLALSQAGYKEVVCADANFGVFEDRDIDILKFAKENGVAIVDSSLAKTKDLKRRIRLIDRLFDVVKPYESQRSVLIPNVGIQSISDEAMKVAKRTDLSVADKIALGKHIKTQCDKYGYKTFLELIRGMPGSTLEDFYAEWEIIYTLEAHNGTWRYDYMVLPDSAANDPDYCKLYDIELVNVYTDNVDELEVKVGELYSNRQSHFKTISHCYSYSIHDACEMFFMNIAGNIFIDKYYDTVKAHIDVVKFTKMCWDISTGLDGFKIIYDDIYDILNSKTTARNIKRINGRERNEIISEFVEKNHLEIYTEIFRRIT